MLRVIYALFAGVSSAISVLLFGLAVAYFVAPSIFGFVIISGGAILVVKLCALAAFGLSAVGRFVLAKKVTLFKG